MGRAPYALPKGVPALQEDPVRTRRWFFLVAVGGMVAGALTTKWFSSSPKNTVPLNPISRPVRHLDWTIHAAHGDVQQLLAVAPAFVHVMLEAPEDPRLHIGLEKLLASTTREPGLPFGESRSLS